MLCTFCKESGVDVQVSGFPNLLEIDHRTTSSGSEDTDMNGWNLRYFGTASGRQGQ